MPADIMARLQAGFHIRFIANIKGIGPTMAFLRKGDVMAQGISLVMVISLRKLSYCRVAVCD